MQKLTKEEAKWVKDLQKVLDKCPSERLGFYTIGDPVIYLYDLTYVEQIHSLDGDLVDILRYNGWGFEETLDFPAAVEGVCG